MNDHLLKADDFSKKLNISQSQAFALMKNGTIPTVRFGRCVRVRFEGLVALIERNLFRKSFQNLKAKLAAATASLDIDQVNPSLRKVTTYE